VQEQEEVAPAKVDALWRGRELAQVPAEERELAQALAADQEQDLSRESQFKAAKTRLIPIRQASPSSSSPHTT
jgi:hypothetical protein